jgi:hypothetical protein
MAEDLEIPVDETTDQQNDPLGILTSNKKVDNNDPLGILKKKVDTNVYVNGTTNTFQSNSQLPSIFQNGRDLATFKQFGENTPPELQQKHDAILDRIKQINTPVKSQTPLQKFDNMAAPLLGFNKDITESVSPDKRAEIAHNAAGHWGNIVQNVAAKLEKSGTELAAGTLQLINDAEQAGSPVKLKGSPMEYLISGLNGNKQRMQSVIDNNQLPNTFLGNTVNSIASITPDIIGATLAPEAKVAQGASLLAKAGGLVFNKFTNYLIGKGITTGYGEAKEQGKSTEDAAIQSLKGGLEGVKQGAELAILGAGSGLATKGIMAQAEKQGIVGAKGMALKQLVGLNSDLVAYGLIQPTANAAEEGRFPTMKEIADGAGIAAAFRVKGGIDELRQAKTLNKAIEATQNQRQGVALSNFVDADHDSIKQVYEQPESAQELNLKALEAAKKAKETTDLAKKQEYIAQAITFTKSANVKSVADMVLNNPQGLEDLKNSPDIPDQVKEQFLKKAQEVRDLLQPQEDVSHGNVLGGNITETNGVQVQMPEDINKPNVVPLQKSGVEVQMPNEIKKPKIVELIKEQTPIKYENENWTIKKDNGDGTVEIVKDDGKSHITVKASEIPELNQSQLKTENDGNQEANAQTERGQVLNSENTGSKSNDILPVNEHKIGDEVTVTAKDGTILGEKAKVTAISPDGKFIQTDLGSAYVPTEQVKSNEVKNETTQDNKQAEVKQPIDEKVSENKQPTEEPITENNQKEPPIEPPTELKDTPITNNDFTGVTHAETDKVAQEFGLGEYEKNPETVAEWDAEADKRIKSNPDTISELLAKLNKGQQPDKVEQRIMAKYLASLRAKLNSDPTNDKLINAYKVARDLSDKIGGSEVAKSLVARKELVPVEDTIGDLMVREMNTLGVDKLTDKQKENIVSDFNKMQEAKDEAEAKLKILKEENARLRAEAELKKTTKSTGNQKKSKEDVAKVREDIKQSIKDKWKKASNDGTLTAVPVPYAKQLVAIAPDVAKLVKSYVEEGVTDLKEMTKKVLNDIKEFIPEITEKDVHNIIAGDYNEKKKTKNQLTAKLKDLKDEAVYVNKLEKLLSGEEPKDEKKKIQRNQQIKALQDKIKDYNKEKAEANKFYEEEIPSDVKKLIAYRKRLEAQANDVKNAINKGEYEPEKKKQLGILENPELQKKYPKQFKEALEAKDKLIKLKQEQEIKFLKQQYANRSKSDKVKDAALEVINVPRALMSSFDFSAPLRQGIIPTIAHPELAFKAAKEMFKNAFSQKRFDRYFTNLRESNEFKVMEKSGLYIADPHDHKLSAKEEMFMNNLAEKIPYIGKIVAGSERAYVSYLNKMRADIFTKGASLLAESGKTPENSPEDYKGLASWVNNSTGRGGMSKGMENASPILNSLFFSPRLIASRLNILGLSDVASGGKGFYSKLPKEVRKMAAQDLVKFVGFGLTVLALAKLNGADVEDDPRSSDFGKIRVGDTRYDIWGGFQQYIRFITQLGTGEQKSSTSDRVTELNGKDRFGKTRADVATAFLRGKLAPIPSMTWDFLQGRTAVGQKTDLGTEVLDHFTPLIRNDIQDAWKNEGAKSLLTIGLPATFGVGVQTYQSKPKSNASGGAGAGGTWVRPK